MDAKQKIKTPQNIVKKLLQWYGDHGRDLPWRCDDRTPYGVWLSETMLQQTTVVTVAPYYLEFLQRWPSVGDLASADLDQVLHAWQGLGYYSRARNLYKAACIIAKDLRGEFPDNEQDLLKLPGIGIYTAAAVAAIAYEHPTTPVDGNIERVMARLFNVHENVREKTGRQKIRDYAVQLTPEIDNRHWVQALMDLGATVCKPKKPDCLACPLMDVCQGYKIGSPEQLPIKPPKKKRPVRYGTVYWLVQKNTGAVLLRRRPENGLLGGMMEFPSCDWLERSTPPLGPDYGEQPIITEWRPLPGHVRHVFTHFELRLAVVHGTVNDGLNLAEHCLWCLPDDFHNHALPTVMKKIITHVMSKIL